MKSRPHFDSLRRIRRPALWIGYGVVAVALGAGGMYLAIARLRGPVAAPDGAAAHTEHEGDEEHEDEPAGTVHLPKGKQRTAGIRVEPAHRGDFTRGVQVTGKVTLNEDRVTHIHPLVEGRVHEVNVQFGEIVKAGQVLAVIDSQQVGRAKLDLYQRTLETRLAKVNYDWARQISQNAQALIGDLEKGLPIADIVQRYPNKPMGDFREQLLSAYAELYKARADYKRLKELSDKGITAGKMFIDAEAARDAAQATFSGTLEQIKFTAQRNELSAEQELEKAQTAEAVSREILGILGHRNVDMANIDPAIQGEAISHYLVKAPFGGTLISKDIVLLDQVDPSTQMFSIADFSTVWVSADVYENYLSLLDGLSEKTIRFHTDSYADQDFEARIFYTGKMVDEKTRTADMRAIAENPDRLLKPGMFVELQLPAETIPDVFQVASSAIQEHEGETFVFVQAGEGLFQQKAVTVGRTSDGAVEITAGLKEGEPVVVQGGFALKSEMLGASVAEAGHAH